jgi:hypothetical protein
MRNVKRAELQKQIQKSLKISLKTSESMALNEFIEKGEPLGSRTRLLDLGWHLERVKSERLNDLASELLHS